MSVARRTTSICINVVLLSKVDTSTAFASGLTSFGSIHSCSSRHWADCAPARTMPFLFLDANAHLAGPAFIDSGIACIGRDTLGRENEAGRLFKTFLLDQEFAAINTFVRTAAKPRQQTTSLTLSRLRISKRCLMLFRPPFLILQRIMHLIPPLPCEMSTLCGILCKTLCLQLATAFQMLCIFWIQPHGVLSRVGLTHATWRRRESCRVMVLKTA